MSQEQPANHTHVAVPIALWSQLRKLVWKQTIDDALDIALQMQGCPSFAMPAQPKPVVDLPKDTPPAPGDGAEKDNGAGASSEA